MHWRYSGWLYASSCLPTDLDDFNCLENRAKGSLGGFDVVEVTDFGFGWDLSWGCGLASSSPPTAYYFSNFVWRILRRVPEILLLMSAAFWDFCHFFDALWIWSRCWGCGIRRSHRRGSPRWRRTTSTNISTFENLFLPPPFSRLDSGTRCWSVTARNIGLPLLRNSYPDLQPELAFILLRSFVLFCAFPRRNCFFMLTIWTFSDLKDRPFWNLLSDIGVWTLISLWIVVQQFWNWRILFGRGGGRFGSLYSFLSLFAYFSILCSDSSHWISLHDSAPAYFSTFWNHHLVICFPYPYHPTPFAPTPSF